MQGLILYEGPSVLDGSPIVVIVTGLVNGARNAKTGPMAQVYILRSDIDPMTAVQTGQDAGICGNCGHRGRIVPDGNGATRNVDRSCYVVLMHGPRMVYQTYKRGLYGIVPLDIARRHLKGVKVRLGAYGDPAAVPMSVWDVALDRVKEITGYTHHWRDYPALSSFCMASCDTPEEREEAKRLGFRTFRVRSKDDPALPGEGECPASNEMTERLKAQGKPRIQCSACMLCGGNRTSAKADITITVHGGGARNFRVLAPA